MKSAMGNSPLSTRAITVGLIALKPVRLMGLESGSDRQRQQIYRMATLADKASSDQFFNRVRAMLLASWAG
jgi:hypothetical protein